MTGRDRTAAAAGLLAVAVLFGLAAGLFLVLLGGLRAAVVVAAEASAAGVELLPLTRPTTCSTW
jgi:hypothetical protein